MFLPFVHYDVVRSLDVPIIHIPITVAISVVGTSRGIPVVLLLRIFLVLVDKEKMLGGYIWLRGVLLGNSLYDL